MIGGGVDGGWTDYPFLSDIALFLSTLLLGLSDYDSDLKDNAYNNVKYGKNEYVIRTSFHPDAQLNHIERLNKLSKIAGWVGLVAANVLVFNNDSLSTSNKIGQISVNTLAFSLIASLAIVAGPLGLATYLMAIIMTSVAAMWINSNIFSYNFIRRNEYKEDYYA
ncbi:hypothetical protein MOMA_02175 [Moraxella macacae 0408225]|uniref:Uncharacterized protein n=1 Tax=Moraxella macacae 0408225 TaxID=1230338 RepID=L2F8V0_9GAMM|nr:hypothetical protein [Moraxella macacae]ELA09176.1 hypothetical protein MOMA_02175 [Moraxella macacae 0408225]